MIDTLLAVRSLVPALRRFAAPLVLAAALAPALSAQVPTCQTDLGFQGPGLSSLFVCGDMNSGPGQTFYVQLLNATSFTPALLIGSLVQTPTPFKGGVLVTVPVLFKINLVTDAAGEFLIGNIPGGGGPVTIFMQCATADAGQPHGVSLSNAVMVELQP